MSYIKLTKKGIRIWLVRSPSVRKKSFKIAPFLLRFIFSSHMSRKKKTTILLKDSKVENMAKLNEALDKKNT